MKFRIKFADQVVGFFVIAAVLFLAFILILMGANQRWFKKNYYYTTRFPTSSGISIGMDVKYKGFKIGKLSDITMSKAGEADVQFYIFDDYIDRVTMNSILELETSPILGGTMQFRPGLAKTDPIAEKSFIPSASIPEGKAILSKHLVERPKSDDSISVLMDNVNTLLSGINSLMPQAEAAASGIAKGENSSEIGRILVGLASSIEDLDIILKNVAQMTEDPTGLAVKLLDPKGSLKKLLDDDNEIYNQITDVIESLGKTLKDVEELTSFIAQKRPDLAIMLQDTQRAIKQGNDVLQGLSNNPLLSGGITKEQPQTGTTQGTRDENF